MVCVRLDTGDIIIKKLVQSLIAGTEIALGMALLMYRRLRFDLSTLTGVVGLILLTIGLIRLCIAIWFANFYVVSLVECGVELSAAFLLLSVHKDGRSQGTKS